MNFKLKRTLTTEEQLHINQKQALDVIDKIAIQYVNLLEINEKLIDIQDKDYAKIQELERNIERTNDQIQANNVILEKLKPFMEV